MSRKDLIILSQILNTTLWLIIDGKKC